MSSLSFPDVNVWLALLLGNHTHRGAALAWWSQAAETIAFFRFTQMSVLRLLTTSAAMDVIPLTLKKAWQTYDRLFTDDRVVFLPEPPSVEQEFRKRSASGTASPKVWADAFLIAVAIGRQGRIVTFDRALHSSGADCLILDSAPLA